MVLLKPLTYRVREAAELTNYPRSTVYAAIASGELESIRRGRSIRIPAAALDQWLERHTVRATDHRTEERSTKG